MKKTVNIQKTVSILYVISSVVALCYALAFMTEYKDLFGLKLKLNEQVTTFHDVILQTFNRQILVWALFGAVVILLAFLLQVFNKVPDRFALVVMSAGLLACIYGDFYGIRNIAAIQNYYLNMDVSNLAMEGINDFEYKLSTFRIGQAVYILQLCICIAFIATLFVSHIQYMKLSKKGAN